MSSMIFIACLGTSHYGLLHLFKDAGVVACSLTGIHSVMVKCLFIVYRSWSCMHRGFLGVSTGKNSNDSNLLSTEPMQLALLSLSIGCDRCY
jgi:hypothetical protein